LVAYILVALVFTYRYSVALSAENARPNELEQERVKAGIEKARLKLEKKRLKAEAKARKKD
jgi:hypothetical protein